MFEGRYSGILQPMVHYVPLKKDFSNFDEVMRLYGDEGLRRELTENCHRDLIASGAYSYRRLMEKFDEELMALGLEHAIDEGTVRQVSDLLARSEESLLVKQVEAERIQYDELLKKHVDLQAQYMEQQNRLQQMLEEQYGTGWSLMKALMAQIFRAGVRRVLDLFHIRT
jgi:glycerol-3-phosphate dehydrogenase